eukprot:6213860-Pleurochrysis_carterae.AAC.1
MEGFQATRSLHWGNVPELDAIFALLFIVTCALAAQRGQVALVMSIFIMALCIEQVDAVLVSSAFLRLLVCAACLIVHKCIHARGRRSVVVSQSELIKCPSACPVRRAFALAARTATHQASSTSRTAPRSTPCCSTSRGSIRPSPAPRDWFRNAVQPSRYSVASC